MKSQPQTVRRALVLALSLAVLLPPAGVFAQDTTRYVSKAGSKVKIEGTSTIHDWAVETSLIGGFMELGSDFPLDPAKKPAPGKVNAKVETMIFVSSIKSSKKNMDEVMHETMKQKEFPKITYKLHSLNLKETPKPGEPMKFDSVGVLTVAGTTTTNAVQVTMEPQDNGEKILVKGNTMLKMTDFGMKPPAPAVGLGLIKTGDEVNVSFEWVTAKSKAKQP